MNDEKELKILNRTIKIDVLNDEMTLEADTKLEFRETHISGVDFVSQYGGEVGVCCSRQS